MDKHESLCEALDALTDREGYPVPYTGTAASVIRNQDVEIERLKKQQDHYMRLSSGLSEEVERLRAALDRIESRLLDISWSRQEILAELKEKRSECI